MTWPDCRLGPVVLNWWITSMVLYTSVLSGISHYLLVSRPLPGRIPPALPLCPSDCVVVGVSYSIPYRAISPLLLVKSPYLSLFLELNLYLRSPLPLGPGCNFQWCGVAVKGCCQGGLNPVRFLLNVLFYAVFSHSQPACRRAVLYHSNIVSVLL